MEAQPVPDETCCPWCGAEPTDETLVEHNLAGWGYLHDDVLLTCSECGGDWNVGVPIGDPGKDTYADLWCDACDSAFGRVHFIERPDGDTLPIMLKCANDGCHHTWHIERDFEEWDGDAALVGFPSVTGER